MMSVVRSTTVAWIGLLVICCAPSLEGQEPPRSSALEVPNRIQADVLLEDLRVLSHDSMMGRAVGTPGNEAARRYLLEQFSRRGLRPSGTPSPQPFEVQTVPDAESIEGVNVFGLVPGTEFPERFIVVSAHYDHLGVQNDEVYNGADDNASGTAALLSLGRHFVAHPPRHSILLAAFDAEEWGLQGARAFVATPPVPLDEVLLNVNLDMVSRSERSELYAAGTYHYPFLEPLVDEVAARAPVRLLKGHDRPGLPPGGDWTMASDHAAFHEVGIPFLYFGVEDHPGYHHPSDTFENITPDFYVDAVETILEFLLVVDRDGESILANHGPIGTFDGRQGRFAGTASKYPEP